MNTLKELVKEFSIFPTGPLQTAPMNPDDNSIEFGTGEANAQDFGLDNTGLDVSDSDRNSCRCPCCGMDTTNSEKSPIEDPDMMGDPDDEILAIGSDDPDNLRTSASDEDEFDFIK